MTFENSLTIGLVFLYSLAALGQFFGLLARRAKINAAAGALTLAAFCLNTLAIVYLLAAHGPSAL
ncbi:MAG: hypothetical protein LBJ82_03820, partial [Deltaproteobacteria bacterium]|nr:hypothetical protein [Deltaproteobacteria bacterium]